MKQQDDGIVNVWIRRGLKDVADQRVADLKRQRRRGVSLLDVISRGLHRGFVEQGLIRPATKRRHRKIQSQGNKAGARRGLASLGEA